MGRDRESTRARILDAAERLLTRSGHGAVGVNAIAGEAGVDKVLIYRYFGGVQELLGELARDGKVWPSLAELAPPRSGGGAAAEDAGSGTPGAVALRLLRAELAALRDRPLAQRALAWELSERNALTDALAAKRETRHEELLRAVCTGRRLPPYVDVPALVALLSAGLTYLTLLAEHREAALGLDLQSEDSWRRLDRTLGAVIRTMLDPVEM